MDNFDLKKYLAEGKLSLRKPTTLKEGKGQDLADEYVAKLRVLFKNLNDDELGEFKKTITKSLDLNESINEGDSNPMSNLLQTFEKAMTDKATYDEVVAELEGAPDHVKPKLMQMADEVIPEKREGILELIDDLETGQIDPEDIDANETKEVLIQQFKEFVKVTDFAIATIKKHVNESVNEAKVWTLVSGGKGFLSAAATAKGETTMDLKDALKFKTITQQEHAENMFKLNKELDLEKAMIGNMPKGYALGLMEGKKKGLTGEKLADFAATQGNKFAKSRTLTGSETLKGSLFGIVEAQVKDGISIDDALKNTLANKDFQMLHQKELTLLGLYNQPNAGNNVPGFKPNSLTVSNN
mgnify:CR=1 FL=1